jgi:uncharacterized phage-associated protein
MPTAHDVAAYILRRNGEMTAMKLQSLVYYAQAWSLVWEEAPLFEDPVEAWMQGAVVPSLYRCHRGLFKISAWPQGDPDTLTPAQCETVDAVLDYYGGQPSLWLGQLIRREAPWSQASKGCPDTADRQCEISLASMAEYYSNPY